MDEVGTIERTYPYLMPVQAAVKQLREVSNDFKYWNYLRNVMGGDFFLDEKGNDIPLAEQEKIERETMAMYEASLKKSIKALDAFDLEKAVKADKISLMDKQSVEEIEINWKHRQELRQIRQMQAERDYDDRER